MCWFVFFFYFSEFFPSLFELMQTLRTSKTPWHRDPQPNHILCEEVFLPVNFEPAIASFISYAPLLIPEYTAENHSLYHSDTYGFIDFFRYPRHPPMSRWESPSLFSHIHLTKSVLCKSCVLLLTILTTVPFTFLVPPYSFKGRGTEVAYNMHRTSTFWIHKML